MCERVDFSFKRVNTPFKRVIFRFKCAIPFKPIQVLSVC